MTNLETRSRILLISDNPSETDPLAEQLRRTYSLDTTKDCDDALNQLPKADYDLMVVWANSLRGMSPIAFCNTTFRDRRYRNIPRIVIADQVPPEEREAPLYKTWLMILKDDAGKRVFDETQILAVIDSMIESCPVVRSRPVGSTFPQGFLYQ